MILLQKPILIPLDLDLVLQVLPVHLLQAAAPMTIFQLTSTLNLISSAQWYDNYHTVTLLLKLKYYSNLFSFSEAKERSNGYFP